MCKEKMLIKGAYKFLGVNENFAEDFTKDIVKREGLDKLEDMTIDEIINLVATQIKNDLEQEFIGNGHADKIYKENTEIEMIEFQVQNEDDFLQVLSNNLSFCKELINVEDDNSVLEKMFKKNDPKIKSLTNLKSFLEVDVLNYIDYIEDKYSNISIYAKEEANSLNVRLSYIRNSKDTKKIFKHLKIKSIKEIRDITTQSNGFSNSYLWLNRGDICIKFHIMIKEEIDTIDVDFICIDGNVQFYQKGESLDNEKISLLPKELNI